MYAIHANKILIIKMLILGVFQKMGSVVKYMFQRCFISYKGYLPFTNLL